MTAISKTSALKFCELCNWAYEAWVTHKYLFDENDAPENNIGKAAYFTSRLSVITQEYALLQIAKLHNPAIQRNSLNLTIDYIVRFGNWGDDEEKIRQHVSNLHELWGNIKQARNKLLAHNDLEVIHADEALGSFQQGLDERYFDILQEMVNAVHDKWIGGPYPFNDLAMADVEEFLRILGQN